MKFDSFKPLISVDGRLKWEKWQANRKFYCYQCQIPLIEDIPQLDLPVNFTILKHPGENMKKSSIIVSKIIAPANVEINNSLEVPDFDYDTTILLFPKEDSVPVTTMSREELQKIKTVVRYTLCWFRVLCHEQIMYIAFSRSALSLINILLGIDWLNMASSQ